MYASAAWLLWVLAQQTSSLGLGAALTGVILIALSGWAYQKSKSSGRTMRLTALATALAAFVLAVLLPLRFDDAAAASTAKTAAAVQEAGGWQPYDAARAAEITAAGRPLLINFTASWCLTCLVNERNAFSDEAVRAVFRDKDVTLMKGDWTNRDPVITKALAAFGRAGVPLYVVYNAKPGSSEPLVLPQLLTATIVHDAFVDSSERDLK
jgi:thiol:disulfide interchange protein DsbD